MLFVNALILAILIPKIVTIEIFFGIFIQKFLTFLNLFQQYVYFVQSHRKSTLWFQFF